MQPDPVILEQVESLQRWLNAMDRIAYEMKCAGFKHWSDHIDSITSDVRFYQHLVLKENGPLVWKKNA